MRRQERLKWQSSHTFPLVVRRLSGLQLAALARKLLLLVLEPSIKGVSVEQGLQHAPPSYVLRPAYWHPRFPDLLRALLVLADSRDLGCTS